MPKSRRRKGTGQILKRKDGWCATISTAALGLTTPQKTLSFNDRNRSACVAWLNQKLREAQAGTLAAPNRRTVAAYMADWLASRSDLRVTTRGLYEAIIRAHIVPYIGTRTLGDLRPADLRRFHAELEQNAVSARNRRHVHVLLFSALRVAVLDGDLAANPLASVAAPRYEAPRRQPLTEEQVAALLDAAAGDRYEALYALAVGTGLRAGELFGLQWTDLDWELGRLTVQRTLTQHQGRTLVHDPKTAAGRRTIDLDDELLAVLRRHRHRAFEAGHRAEAWVFTDPKGGPIDKRNFARREWMPMRAKAGLPPIHFHDLRHTSMALLIARGAHIKVIQERAGHTDSAFTMNAYGHVMPTLGRAAAESVGPIFRKLNQAR